MTSLGVLEMIAKLLQHASKLMLKPSEMLLHASKPLLKLSELLLHASKLLPTQITDPMNFSHLITAGNLKFNIIFTDV